MRVQQPGTCIAEGLAFSVLIHWIPVHSLCALHGLVIGGSGLVMASSSESAPHPGESVLFHQVCGESVPCTLRHFWYKGGGGCTLHLFPYHMGALTYMRQQSWCVMRGLERVAIGPRFYDVAVSLRAAAIPLGWADNGLQGCL